MSGTSRTQRFLQRVEYPGGEWLLMYNLPEKRDFYLIKGFRLDIEKREPEGEYIVIDESNPYNHSLASGKPFHLVPHRLFVMKNLVLKGNPVLEVEPEFRKVDRPFSSIPILVNKVYLGNDGVRKGISSACFDWKINKVFKNPFGTESSYPGSLQKRWREILDNAY